MVRYRRRQALVQQKPQRMNHVCFAYVIASNHQAVFGQIDASVSKISVLPQFNIIDFHKVLESLLLPLLSAIGYRLSAIGDEIRLFG